AGELHAKVTDEQVAQAKALDREMKLIKVSGEAWKKELVYGMLPGLQEGAKAFLDVTSGTGGLREGVQKLSKDGSIADWTRGAIIGLTYMLDAVIYVKRAFQSLGEFIVASVTSSVEFFSSVGAAMGKAMKLDPIGAMAEMKSAVAVQKSIWAEFGNSMADTWVETFGSKIRTRMDELNGKILAKKDNRPAANGDLTTDKTGKVDPQIKAYADLVASIEMKIGAMEKELAVGRKLNDAEKEQLLIDEMVKKKTISKADAESDLTVKLLARMEVDRQLVDLQERRIKADFASAEAHVKFLQTTDAEIKKVEDEVAALKLHTAQMGLSKSAVQELNDAKQDEIALGIERLAQRKYEKDLNEAEYNQQLLLAKVYRDKGKAEREAGLKQEEVDKFKRIWDSVDKTAQQAFTNIFEGGQNVFKKLTDTLKSTLLALLYDMTVRQWAFNITASVASPSAGVTAAVGQATGVTGAGGMLGNLGGMLGGGGAAGAGLMTGLGSWGGGLAGVGGALEAGAGLIGGGSIAGGLGMLAGALGPVAIALGAIALLPSKGGGPKTEAGFSPNGLGIAGTDIGGTMQGPQRGDVGEAQKISQGISASYAALATQ
ncbi:MAG: hypothetical protein H7147_00640, partial [Frankiaceae bacterium]|nr:hypothetical protein [Arenimonas sp.]